MISDLSNTMPRMGELHVSNEYLGDPAALVKAWERDGYWFFRDVLDKEEIGCIRRIYVDYLIAMGVVDPDDPEARYNGSDYSHLPVNSNETKLNQDKVHKLLHEAPNINNFFTKLFGCDPCWIPFTIHRTNPPARDRSVNRLEYIHEDGAYNEGLDFLICWVPLDDIDADVGGLALLEGVHNGPCLHRREGLTVHAIRPEDVPEGTWRRTDYRPGDVLLMGLHTPHTGLVNISNDRFRLSMDTRIMPSNGKLPLIGKIVEISAQGVSVCTSTGDRKLRFGDRTFIRGNNGRQVPLDQASTLFGPGDDVILAYEGDMATNVRPPT